MRLAAAILKSHGVYAQWVTSTAVSIKMPDGGTWQGDVQTYELIRHKTARYCYAWANDLSDGSEVIMALKVPPVSSPTSAAAEYLRNRAKDNPKTPPKK